VLLVRASFRTLTLTTNAEQLELRAQWRRGQYAAAVCTCGDFSMLRRRSFSFVVLAALVASGSVVPSARAEVPKEIKSKFTRVKDLVAKCDERRLEKAKEISKDFPSDIPEVIELRKEIEACEGQVNKQRAAESDAAAQQAEASALLEAGAAKDLENVQAMTAALEDIALATGSTAEHIAESVLDDLRRWPKVKQEAQRLIGTYGALKLPPAEKKPAARDMWLAMSRLKKTLADTEGRIATFVKDAPSLAAKPLDFAEKEASTAVAARDARSFMGPVRNYLGTARFYLDQADVLGAGGEAVDAKRLATERARLGKVVDQGKSLATEIIKSNTLPKDNYGGGDRAAITAAITKAWLGANPHSPPLKIILTSTEWARYKKLVWNDASSSWVKQDYSNLAGYVVFKSKDGKYAYFIDVAAQKNHLNGDKLGAVVTPKESSEIPADMTVLIGAVR
jgi:hypothetical protein